MSFLTVGLDSFIYAVGLDLCILAVGLDSGKRRMFQLVSVTMVNTRPGFY